MAIRTIRTEGDPVLEKVCKPVAKMSLRMKVLVKDMFDTMYDASGVGLAAPQVGVLRRIAVIDVDGEHPYVFVNPEIIEMSGEQTGDEGCLSIPGMTGTVTRPDYVKVKAFDINMEPFELEATGLLARACCHEFEHLDGVLYTCHVQGRLRHVGEPAEDFEEIFDDFGEELSEE
uniref:peptide deformylase n=1 Tax=Eubacterium cellulosolvens TaxID=29322 RepID=UPI000480C466|nr:peptide deformylase [[Eubacterium] cellulosolvens]